MSPYTKRLSEFCLDTGAPVYAVTAQELLHLVIKAGPAAFLGRLINGSP